MSALIDGDEMRGGLPTTAILLGFLLGCSTDASEVGPVPNCLGQADGTACVPIDPCGATGVCRAESCLVNEVRSCPDEGPCRPGQCNPSTGACETRAVSSGSCNDGSACTAQDRCRLGVCVGEVVDDRCPPEPCRRPVQCGEAGCVYEDLPDGTACEDDNACTEAGLCQAGVCASPPIVCPDPGPCQLALQCDPVDGCLSAPATDGASCDDGDPCTTASACNEGTCLPTEVVVCADGPCIASSTCNPSSGRCEPLFVQDGTACDDRNRCTENNVCFDGECSPGDPIPQGGAFCSEGICFEERATERGLGFVAQPGNFYDHGAPVALFDADGDGDLDVLMGTELTPPELYLNDGSARFIEASDAGLDVQLSLDQLLFDFGVADVDEDGDLDVLIATSGSRNLLFMNDGSGQFTEEGASRGLSSQSYSVTSDFGDFDGDGDLDLVVGNYITPPSAFPDHNPTPNEVYLNDGSGRFTEVTNQYTTARGTVGGNGTTLVARWTHLNDDDHLDLVECNDFGNLVEPSRAYLNQGPEEPPATRFVEASESLGLDLELFCMSITPLDFDRDGDLDYYFTNIGDHQLMERRENGYVDRALELGAGLGPHECLEDRVSAGWSALGGDYDQDGWPDLFSANGFIIASADRQNGRRSRNSLLRNRGDGLGFDDVSISAGVDSLTKARGAAQGDLDGDGDLDLVVNHMLGPAELFLNVSPSPGNWLGVRLLDAAGGPGLHARIEVDAEGQLGSFEVSRRTGYGGQSGLLAHFGLGEAESAVVRVRWPSGDVQSTNVVANQVVLIEEPRTGD
ncbi:MAG: CRTAC1 family protein [Myxococcota bacterium]